MKISMELHLKTLHLKLHIIVQGICRSRAFLNCSYSLRLAPNSFERNEDQRGKLRELELKVIRYQDELEAGIHNQISGMSVSEQVQQYREHLLRKVCEISQLFNRYLLLLVGFP